MSTLLVYRGGMLTTLCVCGVLIAGGCRPADEPKSRSAVQTGPAERVRLARVEAQMFPIHEEVVGTIRARLRATLEAKVSGRIRELPVRLGQSVKAGDLIARLDAAEVRARLDQAQAALQQAERDYRRVKSLFEQQATSRAEMDTAESRYNVAQGAVAEAQAMMAYAEVRSPFDGVVTRKHAEVGDFAAPGKPLVDVEDPSALQLVADIPEALAGRVHAGDRMVIRADANTNFVAGTISEIAPAADPLSRTFQVKVDLEPRSQARSGQFARLRVLLGENQSIRVPSSAIRIHGQMEIAFVADGGIARLRLVRTGREAGTDVEVLSGLQAGESVVEQPPNNLRDGQKVEIQ